MKDSGTPHEHHQETEHQRLIGVALDALIATRQLHEQLGASGEETVQKNQFGETALRIDVECERTVIEALRASGLPIRVISEEHGITNLAEDPQFLAILDGLDGTKTYREQRGTGRYGTMLGIYSGNHPTYSDYIFGGVAEHGLDRLIFASKGGGAFVRQQEKDRRITTSSLRIIGEKTSFGVDEYFEYNRKLFLPVFKHLNQIKEFSAESRYVDVAAGKMDLAFESSRKGNLEIAAAYGIIREAGGTIVDSDGQDIGSQLYESFGQDSQVPIITAATPELARQAVAMLKKHRGR